MGTFFRDESPVKLSSITRMAYVNQFQANLAEVIGLEYGWIAQGNESDGRLSKPFTELV